MINCNVISERIAGNRLFRDLSEVAFVEDVEMYVIGGFVRDLLLGRQSKDIDITVIGDGIAIAEKIAEKFRTKSVVVFRNFGTAQIKIKGFELEIVGARKESYRKSSRKPRVMPGSLKDDQNRRDFTINALAISLNKTDFGKLIDPFDGLHDLEERIIRTPLEPGITFSDDPLRMMRAIRFSTQLDFDIEDGTFRAITDNSERLSIVSKERITDELNKIILSPCPSVGFNLLIKCGLLEFVFPELYFLKGVEIISNRGHKDNFNHTLEVLDNISRNTDNLWLRWAALLHDIAKPQTKKWDKETGWTFHGHEFVGSKMIPEIFRKMKLPLNEKMKYVQKLVGLHLRPIALVSDEVTDSAIRRLLYEAGDHIEDLMLLAEADITSKNEKKVNRYLENFTQVRQKMKEVEEKDRIRNWQHPISGELIMDTFGIGPSKVVGEIKDCIRNAIFDGIIPNEYEKAYDLMIETGLKFNLSVKS
ncbi:MAG: HD domain-containing protein [Bacteroidota bacterium]